MVDDPLHPPGSAARPDLLIACSQLLRRFSFADGGRVSTVPVTISGFDPVALAPTPSGWLVVACYGTGSVWAIHPVTGQYVLLWGTGRHALFFGGTVFNPRAVVVGSGVNPDPANTHFLTPTVAVDAKETAAAAAANATPAAALPPAAVLHAFILDVHPGVVCLPLPAWMAAPRAHA